MPKVMLAGSEGELFLHQNTLSSFGEDEKRRGSMLLGVGDQPYREVPELVTTTWFHIRFALTNSEGAGNYTSHLPFITIKGRTSAGQDEATIFDMIPTGRMDDTNYIRTRHGGGTTGPTYPNDTGKFQTYDIKITNNGSSTEIVVFRNEVKRSTKTVSTGYFASSLTLQPQNEDEGYAGVYFQDIIVTDDLSTVGMELATLAPAALGSYDEFSNDYTAIDDRGYDQNTVMTASAVGDRESWFYAEPEFTLGDKVIYGIAMTLVAQTDLTGTVSDFNPFLRISATNYNGGAVGAESDAPGSFLTIWTQNPNTSAPWTRDDITGLEAGVRAV